MKKTLLLLGMFGTILLVGCSPRDRANWLGTPQEVCHKGVAYLQFESGATIALSPDGKPLKC